MRNDANRLEMTQTFNVSSHFGEDEAGATAIEYTLIVVGIAVVLVAAMPTIVDKLTETFTSISGGLN